MSPPHPEPPDEIVALARQRTGARATHDWARADALRAEIEAAGWKVIDRGTAFRLEPAAPPTLEQEGVVRYGAASAVPSVLEEPPRARFSVQLVADDWPDDLARSLAGLRAHAPGGTQIVIVANDPSPEQTARLAPGTPDLAAIAGAEPEVIWTSERLGPAAARNVGLRRARGAIIVFADTSIEPVGDALGPLGAALDDPDVAVAGAFGFVSSDLRRFQDAPGPAVDAVELDWAAFRRDDCVALGPLDEKLTSERSLNTWWSLVLRAGLRDGPPPRGAVRLDLPLVRHAGRPSSTLPEAERDRRARRDFYRILEGFRHRPDLLSGTASGATSRPAGATRHGDEPQAGSGGEE